MVTANTVKEKGTMNKIQKDLSLTCPACQTFYQLLEIHKQDFQSELCGKKCLAHWKSLLHSHYQEQIILHLAQQEAQKDHEK